MQGKTLYYECFSGISGDMNLAGMLGLGVPQNYLESELAKLGLPGWKLKVGQAAKKGIHGLRVDVELATTGFRVISAQPGGAHRAPLNPATASTTHHDHRNLSDIRTMIIQSTLNQNVKDTAVAIFVELAKAEAKVHAMEVETVHFHEVGAVDSIIDIVGAAICFDWLKPARVICSTVELGGGMVRCQHGLIPVPAPAVVEILSGVPVKTGGADKETTTPTGAAILKVLVDQFVQKTEGIIVQTACGIGHRDLEIPNLLRVSLLDESSSASQSRTLPNEKASATVLECNIDDMSGELCGALIATCIAQGASDAWITPIIMKKSRPAIMFSVLCASAEAGKFVDLLLRETSTLGVRETAVLKTMLERRTETKQTSLGPVRVKVALYKGSPFKQKAEFEDILRLSQEHGMPARQAHELINRELGLLET